MSWLSPRNCVLKPESSGSPWEHFAVQGSTFCVRCVRGVGRQSLGTGTAYPVRATPRVSRVHTITTKTFNVAAEPLHLDRDRDPIRANPLTVCRRNYCSPLPTPRAHIVSSRNGATSPDSVLPPAAVAPAMNLSLARFHCRAL